MSFQHVCCIEPKTMGLAGKRVSETRPPPPSKDQRGGPIFACFNFFNPMSIAIKRNIKFFLKYKFG